MTGAVTMLVAHHDVLHIAGAVSVMSSTGVSAALLFRMAQLHRKKNRRTVLPAPQPSERSDVANEDRQRVPGERTA